MITRWLMIGREATLCIKKRLKNQGLLRPFIVIGIGGSYLGSTKAVITAYEYFFNDEETDRKALKFISRQ